MARHIFEPAAYANTLGSHEPALKVDSGDTVITRTLDAAGADSEFRKLGEGGNPQTGPFYVNGAEPGDTLMIRLVRLQPNREKAWSYVGLQPNVVDPHRVRDLPEWSTVDWHIDRKENKATIIDGPEELKSLKFPMSPFLGSFGVAPSRGQAITSITAGDHGGNMDYRGFKAGVSVYFPVFAEGALFFLGDGHALQGDGEISGSGVEISFDVEFTVELLKGKKINRPRGENAEYIFTVGNARPLDQAVQHATTEMLSWLEEDYRLGKTAASILLGQCVEYDVGNVIDPAYTMVCKMAKSVLFRLS
jgi:amidase